MNPNSVARLRSAIQTQFQTFGPGLLLVGTIAAAAGFLSRTHGGPVMLFALLLGMSLSFLSADARCAPGIGLASRQLLRIGVALLGLRITVAQVGALGWGPVALVLVSVPLLMLASRWAARRLGYSPAFGLLSGGSVAICGASAALAIASVLPAHPQKDKATSLTVVIVSLLSTVAMVVYPMVAQALSLDTHQTGVFLGATIHDVAQVVGAGYSVSRDSGDTATVVKLLRVAMLVPVVLVLVLLARQATAGSAGPTDGPRPPLIPGFVLAFVALMGLSSGVTVPAVVVQWGSDGSRLCLVMAIAGIGLKTQLQQVLSVGWKPVGLMVGQTLALAVSAALVVKLWA